MAYDESSLKYFRKKYRHAKLIHYFLNTFSGDSAWLAYTWSRVKHLYDAGITFNRLDAEKYGLLYLDYRVGFKPDKQFQPENASDVFLVASAKDRVAKFLDVYECFSEAGLKCDFWIVGVPENEQKYSDKIHYNTHLSYDEVCQKVVNTKCVLEILPFGQNYSSVRPYESLWYHKKLLTTNINAPLEWYYHPEIVQVFSEPSQIDTDFITKPLSPEDEHRIFDGMRLGDFNVLADFIIRNVHRKDS